MNAGMDEQERRAQVARFKTLQELEVTRRHPLARLLEVCVLDDVVALHGGEAAVAQKRFAVVSLHPQKIQHHVFMVALEKNGGGMGLLEFYQQIDHVTSRRTAVNIIAHENHGIGAIGVDMPEDCA